MNNGIITLETDWRNSNSIGIGSLVGLDNNGRAIGIDIGSQNDRTVVGIAQSYSREDGTIDVLINDIITMNIGVGELESSSKLLDIKENKKIKSNHEIIKDRLNAII